MELLPDNPTKHLRKSLIQHTNGIICPAVMWGKILDVLTLDNVGSVLDSFTAEEHAEFKRVYLERPLSFQHEAAKNPLIAAIVERWIGVGEDTSSE